MKVKATYTEEVSYTQVVEISDEDFAEWAGGKEPTPDLLREYLVSDSEWHEWVSGERTMRSSEVDWCDAIMVRAELA